ncbi:hypothetical protein AABB24_006950 [Solanum stoloniferum]|uniref:RING-type domain-containing protein n=2 Tax=Solanum TaxID=4107 RepID=A0AAF0QMF1_SOLVR|nr:RING-H2 finger protein ATL63-like [Solanum verrucosum]WMV22549.1 hypothetical protein MTR67_015934 [Solanum verrucosum]
MAQVVSPSTSSCSSEMIAVAVIAAFPIMSIITAHKDALLSIVIASKYSISTQKQDNNCVNDHLTCIICLGDISLAESRRVLTICGHEFHTHCIDSWLNINSICPLCRIPVPANISMRSCTKNRFVSSLISAVDNIWNWFLDPLSSEVIASLTNMECLG